MDPIAMATLILIGTFILFLILKVPIAFALGISSLLTMIYLKLPPMVVFQRITVGINNFSMMAIPFFILAGQIMADGGIAESLINFANLFVGKIRGGLAIVDIIAAMLFGALSGSSMAGVSALGSMLVPEMVKEGYDRDYSVAVTTTASTSAIIIPPSHNMVIYSMAAGGVSIGALFMAGVIPGIILGISLMIPAYIIARKRNYPVGKKFEVKDPKRTIIETILGLLTIIIILGGILSGFFTATEASAVAVVYAFLVSAFVFRREPVREFSNTFLKAGKTTVLVLFLIANAAAFGWLLSYLNVPGRFAAALMGVTQNPFLLLLIINIILLLFGLFMDMAPLIIITTPIFLPIVTQLGMSPIQFGVMLLLNLSIGLCTPPVGNTLFAGCAIGGVSIEEETRAIWPFYIAMIAALLLVTYVPLLSTWLPSIVM